MQDLEQKHTAAQAQCDSLRAKLLQEQGRTKAAKLRLQQLEQERGAESDLQRQLIADQELVGQRQEQLRSERVGLLILVGLHNRLEVNVPQSGLAALAAGHTAARHMA